MVTGISNKIVAFISHLTVLILLLINITELDCYAQEYVRYATDMAHLPFGADIAAMGDAGVVLPQRASAVLWNPASVSIRPKFEIAAEFADLYQGLSQQGSFTIQMPLKSQMAVSAMYVPFFSGNIPLYDSLKGTYQQLLENEKLRSTGTPIGYFRNNQHLLLVSVGKTFSFKMPTMAGYGIPRPFSLSMGINMKGYWQTMNPGKKNYLGVGINADIGIIADMGLDYDMSKKETNRDFLLGITIRDVVPGYIKWVNSPLQYKEKVKYSQYYGLSYVDRSGDLKGNWIFALAVEKYYSTTWHLGIEAEFWNTAVFRVGLSGKIPTLGAGVHYKRYFLDYAFRFDKIELSYLRIAVGMII